MVDNLRRTLSAPAAWLTLAAGWTLPDRLPLVWTTFVLATIAIPALLPAFAEVIPRRSGISKRTHIRAVGRSLRWPYPRSRCGSRSWRIRRGSWATRSGGR